MPSLQECVDGGVPGPGAVGEPVSGGPGRSRRPLFRAGFRLGVRDSRDKGPQAATVLGDRPLGGLAQVVPEMPPVRDLDGLRGAGGGTFGEERRPVPAHDFDTRPVGEPGRQAGRFPVRQQVDGTAGLHVDEEGAVVAALAGGVLVDADHPRCGDLRFGQRVHQTQDGAPAGRHAENGGQPGSGPACQGETDHGKPSAVSQCAGRGGV